jgi:hypothetical protein
MKASNKAISIFLHESNLLYSWGNTLFEYGRSGSRTFDFLGQESITNYFFSANREIIFDFSSRCFIIENGLVSQIDDVASEYLFNQKYILVKVGEYIDSRELIKPKWCFYDIDLQRLIQEPVFQERLILTSNTLFSLGRFLTAYRPVSVKPIWRFDLFSYFDQIGEELVKKELDGPARLFFIRILGRWKNYLIIQFNKFRIMYLAYESGDLIFVSDHMALKYPDNLVVNEKPSSDDYWWEWYLDEENSKVYLLIINVFVEFDLNTREWFLKKEFPLIGAGYWHFYRTNYWKNKIYFVTREDGFRPNIFGVFDIDKLDVVWSKQFKDVLGPIQVNDHYITVFGEDNEWYLFTHEEVESEIQKNQNQ